MKRAYFKNHKAALLFLAAIPEKYLTDFGFVPNGFKVSWCLL